MNVGVVFAVRHVASQTWLEDTCAGGSWAKDARNACTWDSVEECIGALVGAELVGDSGFGDCQLELVQLIGVGS